MAKDVELVIRARNEATRAIDSIKDALEELTGVQEQVGKSASKTDSILTDLGRQLAQLNKEAQGLSSLGKIATELDKAGGAVGRLEANLRSSASEFERLGNETKTAEANISRLKQQSTQLTNDLKAQAAATKEARAAQTAANAELRTAERVLGTLEKRLAKTTKPSEGLVKQVAAQRDLVEGLRANQQVAVSTYQAQRQAQDNTAKSLRDLNVQVKTAEQNQRTLAASAEKAGEAVAKQTTGLAKAKTEFGQIQTIAGQASAAMGGMAVNQDKVAAASNRMALELARTKSRLDALKSAPKTTATVDTSVETTGLQQQRRALLESRREWTQAQAEVKRLAVAMRETTAPTVAMAEAFGKAQGQARLAKQEYVQQQAALARLSGSAQSSFGAFSAAVTQMQRAGATATTANRTIASSATQAANAIRPIAPAANAAGSAMQNAANGGNGLRGALSGVYGESRKALSLMQRLRGEVLSLTGSYLGLQAAINNIGGVVNAFTTLEAAQSRLGAVFNQDTAKVAQELQFLERQAARLGISFGTLSDQYAKFAVASSAANFSAKSTRDIFLSVAEAGRVNKLSIDQLNGIFLALEQMISKGKVSSEELRRQLGDRLPGAFNIFAKAIGVSTAELDDMMRKGKVLSSESNMLKFAAELTRRFGPQLGAALETTTTEMGRFTNNVFQAQLQVARGGFIDGMTNGLRELNAWFQSTDGREFFTSLGAALGRFASGLATLPKYFNEIKIAIEAVVALKLAGMFSGVIASIRQTQGSLTAATASFFTWSGTVKAAQAQMIAFRTSVSPLNGALMTLRSQLLGIGTAATIAGTKFVVMQGALATLRGGLVLVTGAARLMWAAIGGVPGLVLTGITVALGAWMTSTKDATGAMDAHKQVVQDIIQKYQEAKDKTKEWSDEVRGASTIQLTLKISEAQANLKTLRDSLEAPVDAFNVDTKGTVKALTAAVKAFKDGEKSAEDFKKSVNAIAEADPDLDRVIASRFLEVADNAADAEEVIKLLESTLRLVKGEATEADRAVLGLSEAMDDSADASKKASEQSKLFSEALGEIDKLIPSIADELKRLGEIDSLNKLYKDALNVARTMGEVQLATEKYNKALGEINSKAVGDAVKGDIVDKIIGVESGGNASAKNSNSTATGAGQFIESTWLRMFKEYFPDRAAGLTNAMMLEYRKDAQLSRKMVELYVKENAKVLQEAGVAITDANLYLAHFLGPQGAKKLLSAPRGTATADVLGQEQINANKSILQGKNVEDVVAWAQKKMGISKEEAAVNQRLLEIDEKRAEKAKDFNTDLENRLSLQEGENQNAGKLTQEAFVQKRLAEEQKRAREADYTLTEEQISRIKQVAAEEWKVLQSKKDQTNSTKEANVALQQAIALTTQRNTLQKLFTDAQKSGDAGATATYQTQLDDVNLKLQAAIEKARAMWEAIGGPAADVALTKLDNLKLKADTASNSMSFLGLSTQQVGQLAGSFADGLVGVFDSFAQAIANGENAMQALGKAFLQFAADFLRQIATMILKQMILNALQNMGIPGLGAITGHTGGVVGSAGIGSGNMRRNVSPAIFSGAMRYHTGGVVGLAPDEVPAILKKNEEVITKEDPRHRLNGGLEGSSGGSQPVNIRSVITLDPEFAESMMSSSGGEKVIMATLRKNAATLRQLVSG